MRSANELPNGLFSQIKHDLPAGLVVFLVALPLCLGIALASGAPLFSGILSGIVAGVVVSILSGSQLSISGPTASLTAILSSAIVRLGGFEKLLCAVTLAGIIQIALGFLRAGALAALFPNCVIKGMLAAIGIIIILKQIPHALGRDADFVGDEAFWHIMDHENTFTEILRSLATASNGAILISVISLVSMLVWERFLSHRPTSGWTLVPAPLVAVFSGVALNEVFLLHLPKFALTASSGHLVNLPISANITDFFSYFRFPDLSALALESTYVAAFTIAAIASVESLLSLEATDQLDRRKRFSDPNRELKAQGVGNMICGLIGGLPMTSAVVRSSVNVYAGAQTRLACLLHGLLLFVSVTLFASLLNRIPLASLATILIVVGYKLTRVALFRKMFRAGPDQFLPFIVTLVAIVVTDLLSGILIGVIVGFAIVLKTNYYSAVYLVSEGNNYLLRFAKDVSFVNKLKIKRLLAKIPSGSNLLIDGARAMFIDRDIYQLIENFTHSAGNRNIRVELHNMEDKHYPLFKKGKERLSAAAK